MQSDSPSPGLARCQRCHVFARAEELAMGSRGGLLGLPQEPPQGVRPRRRSR